MRHTKAVTRQPAAAQTTLQVKLDFKTGMASVGVGVATSLVGAGGSLSGNLFDGIGAGAFQFLTKAAVPGGGSGGDTGTGTGIGTGTGGDTGGDTGGIGGGATP